MSRRSKETLAVQLFPFLAVLVCTMGSLIFLLLVTTRQIRQRAVAFAAFELSQQELAATAPIEIPAPVMIEPEPEPEPAPPVIAIPPQPVHRSKPIKLPDQDYALALATRQQELSDLKSKWKLRVDQMAKDRDGYLSKLAQQKQQVARNVEESETLKSEVERLEGQLGRISGEAADISMQAKDDAARRLLEKQIAEMKKQLKAAELAELTDTEKFQVVPFDPLTGTTRRPIFLECTEEGIRFLPEDITITAADLAGFTNRVNPLAAGTGALINYWIARNMRQRKSAAEPEPYVLLLVRPNGICAYYVAMKMLEPIRTAHGYELIDNSIALQLPDVDPAAKAACQEAVNRLLAERENVFRSAMNTGGGGSVFGTSSRGGGPGPGRGSGNGSGSYSERMAGTRRGEGNLFTISDVTGDDANQRASETWDPIENFKGRPPRRSGGTASRGEGDAPADGSQAGIAQGTGRPPFSGSTGDPSLGGVKTFGPAIVNPPNGGSGDDSKGPSGSTGNSSDGSNSSQNGSASNDGAPGGRSGGQHGGGTRKGRSNDSGLGAAGMVPEMPVGQRPWKKGSRTSDAANSTSDGQEGDSPDGPADGTSGDEGGSGSGPSKGGTAASNLFSDSTSTASRQANGAKLSPMSGAPNRRSKPSSEPENKQLEPEMLAGRRWGFSEQGASIGFEREVRVDIESDKVVIAEKYVMPIKPGDTKQDMFEQFATSLDRYSHEWGRPPQGFFWTPRLKFIVKPDASAHYEQLNSMVTRAGMSTSHEFAKTAAKIEFGREDLAPAKPATKTATNPAAGRNR